MGYVVVSKSGTVLSVWRSVWAAFGEALRVGGRVQSLRKDVKRG